MNQQDVLQLLKTVGAVITDSHIVYTSGKHGSAYVDKDTVYPYVNATSRLCREIAARFARDSVEAVVAPEKGGIILSQWVAFHLSEMTGREVLAFYAEKDVVTIPDPGGDGRKCFAETGNFIVKRGGAQKKLPGLNVLVVEDILTTGGSAKKVIETVRAMRCHVIGLGVLCNRGGITAQDVGGVPKLTALADVKLDAFNPDNCPLCGNNLGHTQYRDSYQLGKKRYYVNC